MSTAAIAAYLSNVKRRRRRAQFIDSFNRANENLEARSLWERVSGVAGGVTVDTNRARSTTITQSTYLVKDGQEIDLVNHYVEANWLGGSTTGWLITRYADENNYVGMQILALVPTLYTRIAGSFTVIGAGGAFVANDKIRIECRKQNIKLLQNGVVKASVNLADGVLASGRVGIQARSAVANPMLDNFMAGNLRPSW